MTKETKTSKNQLKYGAKYDRKNTIGVYLKLNKISDDDILSYLSSLPNRQGYIKSLIRADMTGNRDIVEKYKLSAKK